MKLHTLAGASLIEGESRAVLSRFPENRFDACVTDPPYELTAARRTSPPPHADNPYGRHRVGVNGDSKPVGGFMGKEWDGTGIAFDVEFWREVLRVLKPGAHLLAFGGSRTSHRMVCAIEDAGFEVRDSLHWFYGQGFPKSLNVGSGRGTALKPGHEPICLARKPLIGTVAANVAQWGTGALNIDACRIAIEGETGRWGGGTRAGGFVDTGAASGSGQPNGKRHDAGRWPANVLLDPEAAAELDEQSGERGAAAPVRGSEPSAASNGLVTNARARVPGAFHADSGGASRFFYVAKPSRKERDQGCDHLPAKSGGEATGRTDGSAGAGNPRAGAGRTGGARNFHPTVKPVELMRYLVRLVTPPGGSVFDPFLGSGTTGMAAQLEGRGFLGIEREAEYMQIALARIAGVQIPDSQTGAA